MDQKQLDRVAASPVAARDLRVAAPAPAPSRRVVDFGVVVGIEDYPYFRSLHGAASDARAFHAWLCDARGGGLDPCNVRLVLSDPEQETPAQDEIDRELVAMLTAAKAGGGGRRLYFYFSGHGAMNPDRMRNDIALLLTRWSESLVRLALSTELYSSTLCSTGLFDEVAIFIDGCRSISASVVGLEPLFVHTWGAQTGAARRFLAFATEACNPAFEYPESARWHGIFTQCLLSILREPSNGGIRADQLKVRLESDVEKKARCHRVFQRAHVDSGFLEESCFGTGRRSSSLARLSSRVRGSWVGRLPVVRSWSLLESGPPLELWFSRRRGKVVLLNGDLQIVAEHLADDRPWRLRLPGGIYQVQGGGEDPVRFEHDGWKVSHEV